jgi:sugar phosphate isomerase/epimerase
MYIGVLVDLNNDVETSVFKVRSLGLKSCQLCNWNNEFWTAALAKRAIAACEANGVAISTLWAGWSGPKVWNFIEGPLTLGLLPPAYRSERVEDLKRGADFAKLLGVDQVATHAGFIPENPNDPEYPGMIAALKEIARYLGDMGKRFLFETGQETPVTLIRAFEDIGEQNLGVNLDPANLMMYGKANPVDALSLLGPYVMDVHAKDGGYPTGGKELGNEYALGTGCVDFPALIKGLKAYGYDGALTIEREISGEEQVRDILSAKAYLEALI